MINSHAIAINHILENDSYATQSLFSFVAEQVTNNDPEGWVAESIKDYVEEESKINEGVGLGMIQTTLMQIGLQEVDWRELAEYWIGKWKLYQP